MIIIWIRAEWATDRYCSRENEFYYCEAQGFKMSAGFPQSRSGSIWSKSFMSKNRKKLSVDEVVCNLLSLISPSRMSTPILHLLLLHKKVWLGGACVCREQDGSQTLVLWKYFKYYIVLMLHIWWRRYSTLAKPFYWHWFKSKLFL